MDPMWQLSRTCSNVAISALIQDWGLDGVDPSRHYHSSRNRNSKLFFRSRLTGQRMASEPLPPSIITFERGRSVHEVMCVCVYEYTYRSEHMYDMRIYIYTIHRYIS